MEFSVIIKLIHHPLGTPSQLQPMTKQTTTGSSLFGTVSPGVGSLFTPQKPSTESTSLFGSPTQTGNNSAGSLFGIKKQDDIKPELTQAPKQGLFGQRPEPSSSGSGLFGLKKN